MTTEVSCSYHSQCLFYSSATDLSAGNMLKEIYCRHPLFRVCAIYRLFNQGLDVPNVLTPDGDIKIDDADDLLLV